MFSCGILNAYVGCVGSPMVRKRQAFPEGPDPNVCEHDHLHGLQGSGHLPLILKPVNVNSPVATSLPASHLYII